MAGRSALTLPRSRIALFQSELEALRTPAHDIGPFLRADRTRWQMRSFDEHTLAAALEEQSRFDALVVGYNALHQSTAAQAIFNHRRPRGSQLILHQLSAGCFSFLTGKFGLELEDLPDQQAAHPLRFPAERNPEEEALLNWPELLPADHDRVVLEARALRSFAPAEGSVWRAVLTVERGAERFPVVMRTAAVVPERLVVCSLLLEWRDPVHAALLNNMLTYCALGVPEVAVLAVAGEDAPHYDPLLLADRLRLRRARAVVANVESRASIPADAWPLRVVRHVVVPDTVPVEAVLANGGAWARAGGALTRVGPGGELTLHSRATDARWVAERWSTWYGGTDPSTWQGRLGTARAVLRVLAALHTLPDAGELGLEAPNEYPATALAAMLQSRIRGGSCEDTISATAAALDIDLLLGERGLHRGTRREVQRWLRDAFSNAPGRVPSDRRPPPLEDQLDIARALCDQNLLGAAWSHMGEQPITALSLTRMREALVACRAWDRFAELPANVQAALNGDDVLAELEEGVFLSAEFLSAAAELNRVAPHHPAGQLGGPAVRLAAATIARRGAVARIDSANGTDATGISTDALALLRHMTVLPTTTRQIRPEAEGLPAQAVEEVLHEARHSRELVRREGENRVALGRSTLLLGAAAVSLMSVAVAWTFGWADVRSPEWAIIAGGLVVGIVALFVTSMIRSRRGDPAPALAADLLGALGIVGAGCLAYLALQLEPTVEGALNTLIALIVLGALVSLVLALLAVAGLTPMWADRLRSALEERNVPLFRASGAGQDSREV